MPPEQLRSFLEARFTEAKFRPYALALGQATLAWNDLHEHLGRLFGIVMTRSDRSHQLAVWQSSQSDRAKRKMLSAALDAMPFEAPGWTEELRLYGPWLLIQANGLEDRRNNVVHAPLHLVVNLAGLAEPLDDAALMDAAVVRPHTWGRNYRAKRIEAKELLGEYRACRDDALALRDLTMAIGNCLDRRRREQLNYAWPRLPGHLASKASPPIRAHQAKTARP